MAITSKCLEGHCRNEFGSGSHLCSVWVKHVLFLLEALDLENFGMMTFRRMKVPLKQRIASESTFSPLPPSDVIFITFHSAGAY